MLSSTSSFKPSENPPTYQREIPAGRLGLTWIAAIACFLLGLLAWEMNWRAYGSVPSYRNSDGLWAMQRRRIDAGEGDRTVIIGSSRLLFDIQLPVWERSFGERPIQLALEGTGPVPFLEDLANDPHFTGRLLIGVSPVLYFMGFDRRVGALDLLQRETLAQRAGQWLSMHLVEPFFAYYDEDFALMTVLKRQPWPDRAGAPSPPEVRKLSTHGADRNFQMWSKVENDPQYQEMARRTWSQLIKWRRKGGPPPDPAKLREEHIRRSIAAVAKLRARGVPVIFVRPPSAGEWLAAEEGGFPRAETWDVLLQRTEAGGIHFQDYPELQGLTLPEWSHLSRADAEKFTERLCRILHKEFGWALTSPSP
ncbi:MAG: hypothetical protein H0W43_06065 [Chthoniobacterales bacterium]|nr:hypothetical protein [Chthoniobacterales bacterium]